MLPEPTSGRRRAPLAVVVPLHDRADLAARCFAALAEWTVEREVVVVDDGSREPEVGRLRELHPGFVWIRHDTARGFTAAIERGLGATSGDPILLLNSDAEVRPGGDRALLDAFDRHPRCGAVAARLSYPDGRPQWSGGAEPTLLWLFALASGLGARRGRGRSTASGFAGGEVDWAPAAALAIRRRAYERVGPFDRSFEHYAQDLDYGHRLRAAGFEVRVEPTFDVVHHLGGSAGEGAQAGQRLDALWTDLARWVAKARGPRAARRAVAALRAGALLRRSLPGGLAGGDAEERRVAAALEALDRLTFDSP